MNFNFLTFLENQYFIDSFTVFLIILKAVFAFLSIQHKFIEKIDTKRIIFITL